MGMQSPQHIYKFNVSEVYPLNYIFLMVQQIQVYLDK